jgi:hypothetical protein
LMTLTLFWPLSPPPLLRGVFLCIQQPSGESTPFMLPGFALVTGGGSGGLGGSGKKPVGIS